MNAKQVYGVDLVESFKGLSDHPIHKKCYLKLNRREREVCEDFLGELQALEYREAHHRLNRWFLDQPDQRPKKFNLMFHLVCCVMPRVAYHG